jgi:glycosyltransferase involved in cell wall biosynthesis
LNPKVTFIIPCYKLARLLPECVNSILAQTYRDFEILIMDDCSPDETPQVAASFSDPRVKYIRNATNLRHLNNYNKGISLARGEFVWLISADDVLRRPYILERYMEVMERHPEVGYACCPALEMSGGKETGIAAYSVVAKQDRIFKGRQFLKKLRHWNRVIAASGMVRKSCYDKFGAFPLDLPYAGDWYLWCLFALHYDVAYFAEPMVNYRIHELSMTTAIVNNERWICTQDSVEVLWRIVRKAKEAGAHDIAAMFKRATASLYASGLAASPGVTRPFNLEDLNESLVQHTENQREADWIRGMVYAAVGDRYFSRGDPGRATEFYRLALGMNPWRITTRVKLSLLRLGRVGYSIRQAAAGLARVLR